MRGRLSADHRPPVGTPVWNSAFATAVPDLVEPTLLYTVRPMVGIPTRTVLVQFYAYDCAARARCSEEMNDDVLREEVPRVNRCAFCLCQMQRSLSRFNRRFVPGVN